MNHKQISGLTQAYVLGALDQDEGKLFESHLQIGCLSCAKTITEFQEVIGQLAMETEPVRPRNQLKEQILTALPQHPTMVIPLQERIINTIMILYMKWSIIMSRFRKIGAFIKSPSVFSKDESSHIIIRSNEGKWSNIFPGVAVKVLSVDLEQGLSTILARMDPGSQFPSHIHHGVEQAFLIEGQAHSGDMTLTSHDYLKAGASTYHSQITSKTGCLILLITPDVQFLSEPH